MELVIMRHGETQANERRVYAGKTDVPLTERGERQAREAGVVEGVKRVFVSKLSRARRTAEICFPKAELVEVDGLAELDFGEFEGRSADDMKDDAAYRAWVEGRCVGACPQGECRADLMRRVKAAVADVVKRARAAGDERAIIVGHGGTVMAAMSAFADPDADYFSWQVGNCEGYRMRVALSGESLRFTRWKRFSDLSFLRRDAVFAPQGQLPAHSFFSNVACKYFPCHAGVDPSEFNCLFCYCPLYALGPACGGDFTYTERGRKDCSTCTIPHVRDAGVKLVTRHYDQLARLAAMDDSGRFGS